MRDALMKWIQSKWSTGQLEQISAAKPGTIRFLKLTLDVVFEKSATKNMPVGTVLINQLEYVAKVLARFEEQFMLRGP
eukprot:2532977-Amphidinium_carterae.2